jgi:hypothetical protein
MSRRQLNLGSHKFQTADWAWTLGIRQGTKILWASRKKSSALIENELHQAQLNLLE